MQNLLSLFGLGKKQRKKLKFLIFASNNMPKLLIFLYHAQEGRNFDFSCSLSLQEVFLLTILQEIMLVTSISNLEGNEEM